MQHYRQDQMDGAFGTQSLLQLIRAAASLVGIITIIIGLIYAMRIFALVFDTLRAPDGLPGLMDRWVNVVGGDGLIIVFEGTTYSCANMVALAALGLGTLILARIALGLMQAGAKIVSWTLSDRDAVKRILTEAFGPTGKPPPPPVMPGNKN